MHQEKLRLVILGIGGYTVSASVFNQWTTLVGYTHGAYENDPTARYLLSFSPASEVLGAFLIVFVLIYYGYYAGVKWKRWKVLRLIIASVALFLLVTLAISDTYNGISDLIKIHAYGWL